MTNRQLPSVLKCVFIVAGCSANSTVRTADPTEDCFAYSGLATPAFEEGEPMGPGVEKWCSPAGNWTQYEWEMPRAPGACETRTWIADEDSSGSIKWAEHVHRFTYNQADLLETWSTGDTTQRSYDYDGETLVSFRIEAPTFVELREWDRAGRLLVLDHHATSGRWRSVNAYRYTSEGLASSVVTRTQEAVPDNNVLASTNVTTTVYDPVSGAPSETRKLTDGQLSYLSTVHFDPERGAFLVHVETDGEVRDTQIKCDRFGNQRYGNDPTTIRVDKAGRVVRRGEARRAYDREDRIVRLEGPTLSSLDANMTRVYDDAGRLVCSQEKYGAMEATFDWPPLRPPLGFCSGSCWFSGAPGDDRNRAGFWGRATIDYDAKGHPIEIALDVDADGSIEQLMSLPATYDDRGRLLTERWVGYWWVMASAHRYDCPDAESGPQSTPSR